jgi:hypothetical protein
MKTCPRHPEAYLFQDIMSEVPVCQPCLRGDPADLPMQQEPDDPTNLLLRPREEWTRSTVNPNYRRR